MRRLLSLVVLVLVSAALVGCEASASIGDEKDGDTSYKKTTTVDRDGDTVTKKTEVKKDND